MFFLSSPKEQRKMRLRALVGLFQKTDRILSGKAVSCAIDGDSARAPAWTAGIDVTFADKMVGPVETAEDIVRLTGLNYHELGHVMFTPDIRKEHDALAGLVKSGPPPAQAFNILEDQRQESAMVALWPSIRHYLTAMFVEYIMNRREVNDQGVPVTPDHSTTFVLSHGRRYLGSDIREALEKLFTDQTLIADLKDVIDQYRVLNLDLQIDRNRAAVLVERFIDLMNRLPKNKRDEALKYEHVLVTDNPVGQIKPDRNAKDMEQAKRAIQGVADGDDDPGSGSGSGDGKGDGDDADGDSDSGSGWRSDPGSSSKQGGHGYSPGNNKRRSDTDKDHGDEALNEAVKKALDGILSDDDVKREIGRSQQAMGQMDMPEAIKNKVGFRYFVDPELSATSRRVGRKLQRVVEMQDPGWTHRTPAGRLNVQRVMTGDTPVDEMFDQWDEGNNDAASIEGVILLDTSSSMKGQGQKLSDAAWAMKRSFDSIDAPCTVYEFNDVTTLVYAANDRAKPGRAPRMVIQGNTNPHVGAAEAARRLASSSRKKRVFIVMTDGQWPGARITSDDGHAEKFIEEMNKAGVVTALAYFDSYADRYGGTPTLDEKVNAHKCTIKKSIGDLGDLVDFTNRIVMRLASSR